MIKLTTKASQDDHDCLICWILECACRQATRSTEAVNTTNGSHDVTYHCGKHTRQARWVSANSVLQGVSQC